MLQICPKCGKDQGTPSTECRSCGIVFAKCRAPALTADGESQERGKRFEVYAPTAQKTPRSLVQGPGSTFAQLEPHIRAQL